MGIDNRRSLSRLKESGNVFLALFGAMAIVGVIGGTAAGIMKGPMKTMSDVSSRAMAESEIISNTKMGIMAVSQPTFTKDCDNDGVVEPYPYNSSAVGKTGGVPSGGGYLPSEVETTRWTDPWGNSYTYCVWDHGTLVDDATCGGAGQNRLPGLNTATYAAGDINAQTFVAVLSAGPNRRYETTCQDWATADANSDGDLDDVGDTPLTNKPTGSDDIVMTYTYAEAAMATSSNWRIQSTTTDTAEITEDEIEIGGDTAGGNGVNTTIAGSVTTAGLKLATDPGDDSISGACNAANDQALRVNTGGAQKALEICTGGAWTTISGSSSSAAAGCDITSPVIANGGNAWIQDATKLNGAAAIKIRDDYAYIASGGSTSFTVIDISDPLNPVIANGGNAWFTDGTRLSGAHDIALQGNYAYVTSSGSNSFTVIDISDPLNPVVANGGNAWVQDAAKLDFAYGVEVDGNYAYVTSFQGDSFTVIDISDPLNPVIANGGNAWVQDNTLLEYADGLAINGSYAYVAAYGDHLVVIDISDPLNPVIANGGTAFVQSSTRLDGARDVQIRGDYAYVAVDRDNNFTVVDISDPLNPFIPNGGNAWVQDNTKLQASNALALTGNYAVVAAKAATALTVIDISDPDNPVIANSGNAWVQDGTKLHNTNEIVIDGRYAYATSQAGNSVTVVDLGCDAEGFYGPTGTSIGFDSNKHNCIERNNDSFTELGSQAIADIITSIWHDGIYTYISHGASGISAYSFNGAEFTEVATFDTPVSANKIWGDGTYIYVADGGTASGGLRAYTFDGSAFVQVGHYSGGNAQNVWGDGTYLHYVAGTQIRAMSFDGSTFTLLDSATPSGNPYEIWGDGTYIYVGTSTDVHAYTFDGNNYNHISTTNIIGHAFTTDGKYIYVSNFNNSGPLSYLSALSFDGNSFNVIETRTTPGRIRDIWSDGISILVADDGNGISSYTFDGTEFTEQSNANPSNNVYSVWGDGTYIYAGTNADLLAYSGLECRKAGDKTPGHALEYNYTTEQTITSAVSANTSAENYGTAILLKSSEFGDEAGFAVNVASAPNGSDIAMGAITGARSGNGSAGSLLFKTKDSDGKLKTRMMFDSDGDLGIATEAPFNVSAKIQIGDLDASTADYFQPYAANCEVNAGGPAVQVGYIDTPGGSHNLHLDGSYIYVADRTAGGLRAYTFDGANFTLAGSIVPGSDVYNVWGDGTYIYTADLAGGAFAYTFDGTTFTQVGSVAASHQTYEVWGDGTYIYIADGNSGVHAYTFDGTTFTLLDSYNFPVDPGTALGLWGDGTYIYLSSNNTVHEIAAFTFDGSTFELVASVNAPQWPYDVYGDGTYIYAAVTASGIAVYEFDGNSFTLYDQRDVNQPYTVWHDGANIIAAQGGSGGFRILEFVDDELSITESFGGNVSSRDIVGDGTYLYGVGSGGELWAWSGYECQRADGWQGPRHGLLVNNDSEDGDGPFVQVESLTEGGNRQDVLYHNGYIFFPQNTSGMKVFKPYENGLLQSVGTFATTGHVVELWSDGNYIYTAEGTSGMRVYSFDGANLNELAFYIGAKGMEDVWGDGTYIFSSERDALRAYTFDGTTLNYITATGFGNGGWLCGQGNYIFSSVHSSGSSSILRAHSFNGTAFTFITSLSRTGTGNGVGQIYCDDNSPYIYTNSETSQGLSAYTFDGANFTEVQQFNTATGRVGAVWTDGTYIYAQQGGTPDHTHALTAFTFDGTNFNKISSIYNRSYSITSDGSYLYTATEGGRLNIFSGFSSRPPGIAYYGNEAEGDVDTNILFTDGLEIKGAADGGANTVTDVMSMNAQGTAKFQQGRIDLTGEASNLEFNSRMDLFQYFDSSAQDPGHVILERYKGTLQAPMAIGSGDIIGAITWAGYDGSGIAANGNAAIYAKALGTPSNTSVSSGLFFSTDSGGDALNSSDMALLSTGRLGIQTKSPVEELQVEGRMSMTEGLRIGYDNDCNSEHDKGFIRYVVSDNALEYCTAAEWIALADQITFNFDPESANCTLANSGPFVEVASFDTHQTAYNIWGDGTNIYLGDGNYSNFYAFNFNGENFNLRDEDGSYNYRHLGVHGDGTYIYAAGRNAEVLRAYSFVNGEYQLLATHSPGGGYSVDVWTDGNFIYTANNDNGISVRSFDGTTFTQHAADTAPADMAAVYGDGTYIYTGGGCCGGSYITAYTWDGTTLTQVGTDVPGTQGVTDIRGDGTYIYATAGNAGVYAYTFDGTTFTQIANYDTPGSATGVWTDGAHVFVSDDASGIVALTFNGNSFTLVDSFDTPANAYDIWGDGTHIYVADGTSGIRSYSGFECLATSQPSFNESEELILFNSITKTELKITASDGAATDIFGENIAIDGAYLAVAATQDDDGGTDSGSVYIINAVTGAEIHKLTASDGGFDDKFGDGLDINGNYIAISSPGDDDNGANAGAAYIFDVATGTELFKLTPSDGSGGDRFGRDAVSIFGDYAVFGASGDDDNGSGSGSAYIFNITTGQQLRKLTASDGAANDNFGISVAVNEDYIVVGAIGDDDGASETGSVYVFDVHTGTELRKLTASDAVTLDWFGNAIAIDGKYAAIQALGDDDNGSESGSVYIFNLETGNEIRKIIANDGGVDDWFGTHMDLKGRYLAVGALGHDGDGVDAGAAYIYNILTGELINKVLSSDITASSWFGSGVALDDNTLVLGSMGDSGFIGAAYIYQGSWTDRHTSNVECYPDDFSFDNAGGVTASTVSTTNTVTITGHVKNCVLSVASDSATVDINKNTVAVGVPYVEVSAGDTIELEITSSATAGATLNNIVTLGDKRALFTVTTAP